MSKGIIESVAGTVAVAAGILAPVFLGPAGAAIGKALISAGSGLLLTGVGTLLSGKGPVHGFATTLRDPVAPWEIIYGRKRVGGTLVYVNTFGASNNWLDMIIVLADHSCLSVDEVLFNQSLVQFDSTTGTVNTSGTTVTQVSGINNFSRFNINDLININGVVCTVTSTGSSVISVSPSLGTQFNVPYFGGGSAVSGALPGSGTSFSPAQQNINIRDIRKPANPVGGPGTVIVVSLLNDIPYLEDGDYVTINNQNTGGILTTYQWTGKFPVTIIGRNFVTPFVTTPPYNAGGTVALQFSYVCSGDGNPLHSGPVDNEGQVQTSWANYGPKVYFEMLLGQQTLGQTFYGELYGTPSDGDRSNLILSPGWSDGNNVVVNPWTSTASLVGKTAVFLRLHYDATIFAQGIPQISFLIHGKNYITDVRTSPYTVGYTENPVLCIADYLANKVYGYKLNIGTDIPLSQLIVGANICDQQVPLANPPVSPLTTEPLYTLNGSFLLSMKRAEILSNMLTSMAGRLSVVGGQFYLWPAAWMGTSATIFSDGFYYPTGVPNETISGTQVYQRSIAPFRWKSKVPINQLYNAVKGTYIAQVNKWMASDFPPYAQDAIHGYNNGAAIYDYDLNLTIDQGDRRYLDIQLPFTISCSMAQRIAKIELLRRRQQGTGTFTGSMAWYPIVPMDIVAMDLSYFGWTGKLLEVLAVRLDVKSSNNGGATLSVQLDAQETSPDIYAWDITEELSAQGYQQAILPDLQTPPAPGNFLGSSDNGNIYLTWIEPTDAFVLNGGYIEIQYQLVQSPEGLWISLGQIDPHITVATIPGLIIGEYYNVQIQSVNLAGIPSPWEPAAESLSPLVQVPILVEPPVIWEPGYEVPISGDPLYFEDSFGIDQVYPPGSNASGILDVYLEIYGNPPPLDSQGNQLSLTFKVRREYVSGVLAQESASVSTNTISLGAGSPSTIIANQFVGRIISQLANVQGSVSTVGIRDFLITANDIYGNFTVSPDPLAAGCAAGGGELFTIRTGGPGIGSPATVTSPLVADLTSFTDPLFTNYYNPEGLFPGGNSGNLVLCIGGTGSGQPPVTILTNNGPMGSPPNKVFVTPWTVIPDQTSVLILVEPVPQVSLPGNIVNSSGSSTFLVGTLGVDNYRFAVVRTEAYTTGPGGIQGPIQSVPFREIYIWGAQGTRSVTASTTQMVTDGVIRCDTSLVSRPAAITLISNVLTSDLTIDVSDGTNVVNGTYITLTPGGSFEDVLVTAGGLTSGPVTLTVTRGQLGTAVSAHTSGDTITLPGALIVTLLPQSSAPQQGLWIVKVSVDINYVQYTCASGDTLPSVPAGRTSGILSDASTNSSVFLKASGA